MNLGIPVIILFSYWILALQPDLRAAVPEMIGITAAIATLLGAALYFGERNRIRWSPATILIVAAAARSAFLFRPAELSDDIYRYLWDGLTLLAGSNPYSSAPALVQPVPEALAGLQLMVNHPELVTIYPPAAQLVFAAGALFGGSVFGLKLLLVLLDLASCALIMRLLAAFRLPICYAALYAWHPLPVLEVASSGHIDAAGIFFLLGALALLATNKATAGPQRFQTSDLISQPENGKSIRCFTAGTVFALAALVKLLPLIYLPGVLLGLKRFRGAFLLGIVAGGTALLVPFLLELGNALDTLKTYAANWEFAGFAFRSLRRATGSGEFSRMILAALFLAMAAYRYRRCALDLRRTSAGEGTNRLLSSLRACSEVTVWFLLLTPTLHPWYALYLAALLPFAAGPARLVLCWSVLLSYRVLLPYSIIGQWQEHELTTALVSLAPVAAYLAAGLLPRWKLRS